MTLLLVPSIRVQCNLHLAQLKFTHASVVTLTQSLRVNLLASIAIVAVARSTSCLFVAFTYPSTEIKATMFK